MATDRSILFSKVTQMYKFVPFTAVISLCALSACSTTIFPSSDRIVSMIMQKCDTSQDNHISRSEVRRCDGVQASEAEKFFVRHDKNNDGLISRSELASEVRKQHG